MAACQQGDQAQEQDDTKTGEIPVNSVVVPAEDGMERYTATLSIDGMGCAMACGSKINSALAGLGGVSFTDIDFQGADENNSALVEFDPALLNEKDLIKAINDMPGGHYQVTAVQIVHHTPQSEGDKKEDKADKKESAESFSSLKPKLYYTLPNVFAVFSRLF